MDEETTVWQGHPSQILNLHIFLFCGLLAAGLIAVAYVFRQNLGVPTVYIVGGLAVIPLQRYELTSERLRLRRGVLSRQTDEIELYRVKDYVLHEPFVLRMWGLGDIVLTTTDDANPSVLLKAIEQPDALRDQIRKHVELRREAKRVRITEME
jgi:uncharacterized membrane protein YdbT with pleckstrin-like domain